MRCLVCALAIRIYIYLKLWWIPCRPTAVLLGVLSFSSQQIIRAFSDLKKPSDIYRLEVLLPNRLLQIPLQMMQIQMRRRAVSSGTTLFAILLLIFGRNPYFITKTRLYNFDPFKPHFYIVILGFTGVCIIFLISAQKHRLLVLVRTASRRRF